MPPHPVIPPPPVVGLRYLALGDSYTIGEAVAEKERWPVQLADSLTRQGISVAPPQIIARTGWTTAELAAGITQAAPQGRFDLVSLLIGVNNQFRGQSLAQYETEFAQLLDQAIGFAGGRKHRVVVLSIPDYGATPFGQQRDPAKIARELDEFNAAARVICTDKGIDFFDITPISREAVSQPDLIATDQLHPSGKMYARWVELILGPVRVRLE